MNATVAGAGSLTLSGTNTAIGTIAVNGTSSLHINGNTTSGVVTVGDGTNAATLQGSGILNASVNVAMWFNDPRRQQHRHLDHRRGFDGNGQQRRHRGNRSHFGSPNTITSASLVRLTNAAGVFNVNPSPTGTLNINIVNGGSLNGTESYTFVIAQVAASGNQLASNVQVNGNAVVMTP